MPTLVDLCDRSISCQISKKFLDKIQKYLSCVFFGHSSVSDHLLENETFTGVFSCLSVQFGIFGHSSFIALFI